MSSNIDACSGCQSAYTGCGLSWTAFASSTRGSRLRAEAFSFLSALLMHRYARLSSRHVTRRHIKTVLLNRRRVLLPRVTRDGTLCAPAWLCCHCLAAICCRLLPTLSLSASLATGKSNPRDQTFAPNVPRKECQQAKEPKVALALPKARSSIRLTLSCSFLPHSAVCCSFYRVASISG